MRVRAKTMGFYKGRHIDAGVEFEVQDPKDFADINNADPKIAKFGWMEEVKEEKPESFMHKMFNPKPEEGEQA